MSLVLCACGSVASTGNLPDAPPGADAAIDTVTRGTVRVTVLDPGGTGAPAVGANVVFIDPDGTLVKRAATDSAGKAEADVLPGASVTSVTLVSMTYQMQTVLAVKPGDNLVLGFKNPDSTTAGMFTVSYPANGSATNYSIAHPCGTTFVSAPAGGAPPTSATFTLANSCRQNTMELVVVALDSTNTPLSSISKTGVPFSSGGSTAITGGYSALRTLTANYTNINPVITNLSLTRTVPDALGYGAGQNVASPGSTATVMVSGPSATTATVVTSVINATRSLQTVRQGLAGTALSYGLDVGGSLLPWIGTPTYDAAAGKLVVPLDSTGTSPTDNQPDLFRVFATYRRTDANQMTTTFSWTLFSPVVGDIVLPMLPPEVGSVMPTASDMVAVTTAIMFDADTVTSYDAIRNDVNAAFNLYVSSRPPADRVRLSRAPLLLR